MKNEKGRMQNYKNEKDLKQGTKPYALPKQMQKEE
jgi:hypothetical protein